MANSRQVMTNVPHLYMQVFALQLSYIFFCWCRKQGLFFELLLVTGTKYFGRLSHETWEFCLLCITIRKNKQPVSIGQSSNSHVNRTDSAHSINARSASNMIPCFRANNSSDVHHYDIVSSRSPPSHFTNDTPLNISKVRTRSTTKKLNHCLENQKGYYLRNRNTGKCSCCNSSQDD